MTLFSLTALQQLAVNNHCQITTYSISSEVSVLVCQAVQLSLDAGLNSGEILGCTELAQQVPKTQLLTCSPCWSGSEIESGSGATCGVGTRETPADFDGTVRDCVVSPGISVRPEKFPLVPFFTFSCRQKSSTLPIKRNERYDQTRHIAAANDAADDSQRKLCAGCCTLYT